MTTRWFRSKVDTWIGLLVAVAPIAALVAAFQAPPTPTRWLGPAVLAIVYGVFVFPLRYGIGATELIVRSGLVKRRIPLTEITSVLPTRNPLSSPALSLDRLEIRWARDKRILISPAERTEFLTELRAARVRASGREL